MKRRTAALILAALMSMSLIAGCGANEEPAAGNAAAESSAVEETTATEEEAPAEEAAAEEEAPAEEAATEEAAAEEEAPAEAAAEEEAPAEEEDEEDEEAEISVALMCLAPIDEDVSDHVEKALNEITQSKLNVTVDFTWMDAANYMSQIPMMLQGGESLDLIMFTPMPATSYQSFMNQRQLMDITEYLEEYGQDIMAVMQDYLKATSKDGKIYGVGNLNVLDGKVAIDMRGDVLDELGLTDAARNAKSFDEVEEILKKVTESTDLNGLINSDAEGGVLLPQPFFLGDGDFSNAQWVDTVGDGYQYVYADTADNKIKNYFANEKFLETARLTRKFYDEGLIYKDAATANEYGTILIQNEVGFAMAHQVEMGNETIQAAATGFPDVEVDICDSMISTRAFQKFGFAVPVMSDDPEAAIKVLNLLWSDQKFMDTLTWGVEGEDWVKNEDGTATFPEGSNGAGYHTSDFLYGNKLAITPWEGDGADIRERQAAANDAMEVSPFFGFSVDSAPVDSQIVAVKNVVDKYKPGLGAGIYEDVDGTVAAMISEMDAAGMQDIINEYQSQLDAWLAAQ